MISRIIKDIANFIVVDKPIISVDLGTKRIGIAVSDKMHIVSSPLMIYKRINLKQDLEFIHQQYQNNQSCLLVLGYPFDHNRDNKWKENIEYFAKKLEILYKIPIYLQDEYGTSIKIKNKNKHIDDLSAAYILQKFLSFL